jgi:putative ABC transport system permease protein
MKRISIQDQPKPGVGRTLRITLDGIRYRLFRSLVTVAVMTLAVAFMMNILTESVIKRAIHAGVTGRVDALRQAHDWAARLTQPPTRERVVRMLQDGRPQDETELALMAGPATGAPAALRRIAQDAVAYMKCFEALRYAERRAVCGASVGVAVFDDWQEPAVSAKAQGALAALGPARIPATLPAPDVFAMDWVPLRRHVDRIIAGYAAAIEQLAPARGETPILVQLAAMNADLPAQIRAVGFGLDDATARRVAEQAQVAVNRRCIEKSIENAAVRQCLARMADVMPGDVTLETMWRLLADAGHQKAYLDVVRNHRLDAALLTPERMAAIAAQRVEEQALENAARLTEDLGKGFLGLGQRMTLLIVVSMLVCTIGISNAMLMSVTERFREIATMKCLGAMDGTIMLIFVLESCALGALGGFAGAAGGMILGTARMAAAFGPSLLGMVRGVDLFAAAGMAFVMGIALAAVAAVYPAMKAARLAPMEAMRVE